MKRFLSIILAVVMMLSIAPVTNIFLDTDTTITASAATYYYVKSSSGLRLRKGPSTKYATILTMPNGAKVKYLGSKSNGFYKVSYTKNSRTYTGWCSASYLKSSSSSGSTSVSLSSSDKKYLQYLFNHFYKCDYSKSDYNADVNAYYIMFNTEPGSVFEIFDHYGWSYSSYGSDGYKFSASKVDKALKNIYNVTPDHSMKLTDYYGQVFLYYYNGYYYYDLSYFDSSVPINKITSCTKSNGYYTIKGKVYDAEYGGSASYAGTFTAKLTLKNEMWSIISYTVY